MGSLAFVLLLLAGATALVLLDLVLLARREWHKARVRAIFQSRLRADLERDALIHDRDPRRYSTSDVLVLPLVEEADDYLDIMALRDTQMASRDAQASG